MNQEELQQFCNQILAKKGHEPVTGKFAKEFSDGIMYEKLFNALFDENLNCNLVKSELFEQRLLNWNRINSIICFNYLQQQFYLVSHTMETLAKGTSSEAIFKLLKVTINCHQNIFSECLEVSDQLGDIADKVETKKKLFEDGTNQDEFVKKETPLNDEAFDVSNIQINLPDKYEPGTNTGLRSQEFDFLLNENQNDYSSKSRLARRENFQQYILDLAGGDISKEQMD